MASPIRVTPEMLESAKNKLDSQVSSYSSIYNQLYSEVNNLKQSWKGDANLKFTNQIEGFKNDFQNLDTLLRQYSEFLRQSAVNYRTNEQNLVNSANTLNTGK